MKLTYLQKYTLLDIFNANGEAMGVVPVKDGWVCPAVSDAPVMPSARLAIEAVWKKVTAVGAKQSVYYGGPSYSDTFMWDGSRWVFLDSDSEDEYYAKKDFNSKVSCLLKKAGLCSA